MMVLALFEHKYQVGFLQEIQVLFQSFFQTQVQLLIKVELVATNPQTYHIQSHQCNIMMILYLKHCMYIVGYNPHHQILSQELSHTLRLV